MSKGSGASGGRRGSGGSGGRQARRTALVALAAVAALGGVLVAGTLVGGALERRAAAQGREMAAKVAAEVAKGVATSRRRDGPIRAREQLEAIAVRSLARVLNQGPWRWRKGADLSAVNSIPDSSTIKFPAGTLTGKELKRMLRQAIDHATTEAAWS